MSHADAIRDLVKSLAHKIGARDKEGAISLIDEIEAQSAKGHERLVERAATLRTFIDDHIGKTFDDLEIAVEGLRNAAISAGPSDVRKTLMLD
ncbi:conserved hypothetical protein [Hyphomicrobiales bacterium]|nr:conserved hypothetical protein [Hyphomicrobiales bacterium]